MLRTSVVLHQRLITFLVDFYHFSWRDLRASLMALFYNRLFQYNSLLLRWMLYTICFHYQKLKRLMVSIKMLVNSVLLVLFAQFPYSVHDELILIEAWYGITS